MPAPPFNRELDMAKLPSHVWFVSLALVSLVGCHGSSPQGVALSGRVTYQSKPLEQGSIVFSPPLDKEGRGAQAAIVNGYYSIPAEEGPFPGKMTVRVLSLENDPTPSVDGKPKVVMAVPEKYNLHSDLEVVIPNKKSYSYDFALK